MINTFINTTREIQFTTASIDRNAQVKLRSSFITKLYSHRTALLQPDLRSTQILSTINQALCALSGIEMNHP